MIARQTITLNGRRFGATLDYTREGVSEGDFDLTIILRICLIQNGDMQFHCDIPRLYTTDSPSSEEILFRRVTGIHPDADGRLFMLENWDSSEWTEFCNFYRTESTNFWTNRFTLTSFHPISREQQIRRRDSVLQQMSPTSSIPSTVHCKFRLELTTNTEHAHKIINVYNISPLEVTHRFRANEANYTSRDLESNLIPIIDPDPNLAHLYTNQRTFIHEVGHAIGLEHVGVLFHIPGCNHYVSGSSICYGHDYETSVNVMGRGETLSWREALPWRTAIAELTHTSEHRWEIVNMPLHRITAGSAIMENEVTLEAGSAILD